jgi:hypothetical protein
MRSTQSFWKPVCLVTLMLAIVLGADVVRASAQPSSGEATPFRSEWVVIGGAGDSVGAGQRADRQQAFYAIEWGHLISAPHGPGVLRGQLEMVIEITPVFLAYQSNLAKGAGFSPLMFRWNLRDYGAIHPFLEIAGGFVATNRDVPEGTTRMNFSSHAGTGVRVRVADRWSVVAGYRFHHLSNGSTAPRNPGINSNVGYLGVAYRL